MKFATQISPLFNNKLVFLIFCLASLSRNIKIMNDSIYNLRVISFSSSHKVSTTYKIHPIPTYWVSMRSDWILIWNFPLSNHKEVMGRSQDQNWVNELKLLLINERVSQDWGLILANKHRIFMHFWSWLGFIMTKSYLSNAPKFGVMKWVV